MHTLCCFSALDSFSQHILNDEIENDITLGAIETGPLQMSPSCLLGFFIRMSVYVLALSSFVI